MVDACDAVDPAAVVVVVVGAVVVEGGGSSHANSRAKSSFSCMRR